MGSIIFLLSTNKSDYITRDMLQILSMRVDQIKKCERKCKKAERDYA